MRRTKLNNPSFYIAVDPIGSKFAKALQEAIQERVVNKVYRVAPGTKQGKVFNVTQGTLNKIEQLTQFRANSVSCPAFATSPEEARNLDSGTIFARTLINSTNGKGIVEFERDQREYPPAPLYTAYIPKKSEFRVHVINGKVVDSQQKKKREEFTGESNPRIRNLANGYVYCRDGVVLPHDAADLAVRAVSACGYEYGAVDLIYNAKRDKSYVLEVNSRPGLQGTTLESYADALIDAFELVRK